MKNDLLHEIVEVITSDYNGSLIADEQRADLHVYKNGELSSISEINAEFIIFDDGETIELLDSDIQWLSYIQQCI
tara:strand:+ start:745 stop:969 length:225 start_codon:yes stop_codon:yes gene_type:complete